jgi:hypothetical protein
MRARRGPRSADVRSSQPSPRSAAVPAAGYRGVSPRRARDHLRVDQVPRIACGFGLLLPSTARRDAGRSCGRDGRAPRRRPGAARIACGFRHAPPEHGPARRRPILRPGRPRSSALTRVPRGSPAAFGTLLPSTARRDAGRSCGRAGRAPRRRPSAARIACGFRRAPPERGPARRRPILRPGRPHLATVAEERGRPGRRVPGRLAPACSRGPCHRHLFRIAPAHPSLTNCAAYGRENP